MSCLEELLPLQREKIIVVPNKTVGNVKLGWAIVLVFVIFGTLS